MKPSLSLRFYARIRATAFLFFALGLVSAAALGGDWPQWRGANRDASVTGFTPPQTWPKELKEVWKVTVGDGVATPALVGDKLYVFSWQSSKEVLRCLNADTGKELWKDEYDAAAATGPSSGFKGARSSPAVAEGKVVTYGVQGTVSCFDAESGKLAWRKEKTGRVPRFQTSSSPVIAEGLAIVQIGGDDGGVAAYSLENGNEKWKTRDGSAYASPALLTVDKTPMVVAVTSSNVVGLSLADGKQLWKTPYEGARYSASSPVVDGDTVIFSGSSRGTCAIKIEKEGDGFKVKDLWNNKENNVIFNTPTVHDGLVFGQTPRDELFCLKEENGKIAWTDQLKGGGGGGGKGGGGKGGKGGGMGGGAGYGSIVDAGPVLFSLTPAGKLLVFESNGKEFKELASYKVGTRTYAYPVISGKRIYVKDQDSVIMYSIE